MVSLARAAQCIGRRIQHLDGIKVEGVVERVDAHDVWVREADGSLTPCIPENMEWVRTLTPELREAITVGVHYESAQVFYTPDVFTGDADEDMDYDDYLPGLAVVGSSAIANDDQRNHPLYVIAHHIHRVYPVRITALRDTCFEIEELLGWAES